MKQHINVKQLMELDSKWLKKYIQFELPWSVTEVINADKEKREKMLEKIAEKMNTGKMLETIEKMLKDHDDFMGIDYHMARDEDKASISLYIGEETLKIVRNKCFCDCLFESLKYLSKIYKNKEKINE